mgnify:CR=1 FL=1
MDRGALLKQLRTFETRYAMPRLPQRYAPLVFGIIQAAITTAVATAIATHQLTDFGMQFLEQWAFAWWLAWLTMLPIVILFAPLIQRAVAALTTPSAAWDRS